MEGEVLRDDQRAHPSAASGRHEAGRPLPTARDQRGDAVQLAEAMLDNAALKDIASGKF